MGFGFNKDCIPRVLFALFPPPPPPASFLIYLLEDIWSFNLYFFSSQYRQ